MSTTPDGDPTYGEHFAQFVRMLEARLEAGAREYGDKSFDAPLGQLIDELQQEIIDQCGWSFIAFVRAERLRTKIVDFGDELGESA
jgi:hypothetical protein